MSDIGKYCVVMSQQLGLTYTLRGNDVTPEEVFSDLGLLPAICKRADQLSSLCLGYGIGISLKKEEKSTTGFGVSFDDLTPIPVRMLCIMDVILEIARTDVGDSVALDELLLD